MPDRCAGKVPRRGGWCAHSVRTDTQQHPGTDRNAPTVGAKGSLIAKTAAFVLSMSRLVARVLPRSFAPAFGAFRSFASSHARAAVIQSPQDIVPGANDPAQGDGASSGGQGRSAAIDTVLASLLGVGVLGLGGAGYVF
jgi:hypothetical protein